ncbi:MAG: PEP-utilizing enzyme [Ilumatobacteraceae bacterium]
MTKWITDTQASTRFPVYTRSNASDVLPEPVSPLAATISWLPGVVVGWRDGNVHNGAFEMHELSSEGFIPTVGLFNGYLYINASVVRVFGERSGAGSAGIDAAFFGNRPDTPPYVPHPDDVNDVAGARIGERVGWVLSATEWPEMEESKRIADEARATRPDLTTLDDAALVTRARSFIPLLVRFFDDHTISSSNSAIGPTILGGIVPDLMVRLISGAGDVDSAAPSAAMWQLSRLDPSSDEFVAGFEQFLFEFGSRGPIEWDVYSEVWETRPALALAMIDSMRATGADADPVRRLAAAVADREAATAEALARVAGNDEATGMVHAAQAAGLRFSVWRERTKATCIKAINEQRVALLTLGRRHLAEPRDVFMLLDDELDAFVADPGSFTSTIADRKAEWLALWTLEPPYFIEADKDVPELEALRRRTDVTVTIARSGDVLTGDAGCSGIARGRARVILDPSDPTALEPGDILIAPNTDPAWTPLFVPAGGVVVDVGALNSHAIIVSRELGVPCVVSVVNATKRIPDGALVEVDGGAGTVTVL